MYECYLVGSVSVIRAKECAVSLSNYLTAAPTTPQLPTPEQFSALASELVGEGIVTTPMTLVVGDLVDEDYADYPNDAAVSVLGIGNLAHDVGGRGPDAAQRFASGPVNVEYRDRPATAWNLGDKSNELLPVLQDLPWGAQDIAVYFPSLNFDHQGIDCYSWNADVAVLALREACPAPYLPGLAEVRAHDELGHVWDERPLPSGVDSAWDIDDASYERHPVRWFLQVQGQKGPDFVCPAIHAVLVRHFGPGYFVGVGVGI